MKIHHSVELSDVQGDILRIYKLIIPIPHDHILSDTVSVFPF